MAWWATRTLYTGLMAIAMGLLCYHGRHGPRYNEQVPSSVLVFGHQAGLYRTRCDLRGGRLVAGRRRRGREGEGRRKGLVLVPESIVRWDGEGEGDWLEAGYQPQVGGKRGW